MKQLSGYSTLLCVCLCHLIFLIWYFMFWMGFCFLFFFLVFNPKFYLLFEKLMAITDNWWYWNLRQLNGYNLNINKKDRLIAKERRLFTQKDKHKIDRIIEQPNGFFSSFKFDKNSEFFLLLVWFWTNKKKTEILSCYIQREISNFIFTDKRRSKKFGNPPLAVSIKPTQIQW